MVEATLLPDWIKTPLPSDAKLKLPSNNSSNIFVLIFRFIVASLSGHLYNFRLVKDCSFDG